MPNRPKGPPTQLVRPNLLGGYKTSNTRSPTRYRCPEDHRPIHCEMTTSSPGVAPRIAVSTWNVMATVSTSWPRGAGRRSTFFTVPEKIIPAARANGGKPGPLHGGRGKRGGKRMLVKSGGFVSGSRRARSEVARGISGDAAVWPVTWAAIAIKRIASRQNAVLPRIGKTSSSNVCSEGNRKNMRAYTSGASKISDRCHNRL